MVCSYIVIVTCYPPPSGDSLWVSSACVGESGGDNMSRSGRETRRACVRPVMCNPSPVRPAVVIMGWRHAWWRYSLSHGLARWSDGSYWCVASTHASSRALPVSPTPTSVMLLWILLHGSSTSELLWLVLLHLLKMLHVGCILWDDVHRLRGGRLLYVICLRAHV